MKLPGHNVLIITAVCLSLVASAGAYKYAEHIRIKKEEASRSIVASGSGSANELSPEYKKILEQIELTKIETEASSTNPFAPSASDTLTDSLSKNLFVSYLQYQNNDQLDEAGQQDLANKIVSSIDTSSIPAYKYSLNNVKMFYPKNKEEIKAYGNKLAETRNKYLGQISQNPDMFNNNLPALGKIFSALGEEMMTIPVPSEIALAHLDIANAYIRTGESSKIIANQSKDPLKALLGIRVFKEDSENIAEMFTQVGNYFYKNAILFTAQEPGVIWNVQTTTKTP